MFNVECLKSYTERALLYGDACSHHVIIEGRPSIVCHEDRFDEETDLSDIAPKILGDLELLISVSRHNNSYVNVTVWSGIAFGIRAIHQDSRFALETMSYDLFIVSDEVEGFVAAENSRSSECR